MMYTIECKDPNCVKCKQAPEGLSGEENRCKIPETVEQGSQEEFQKKLLKTVKEMLANDLHSAALDRKTCLSNCRKLKKQVHCEFNVLINILKEREMILCIEIEREYDSQVQKIDENIAASCADKIMKGNDKYKSPSAETMLTFNSDSDDLKRRLMHYGQLKYKDNEELKGTVKKYSQFQANTDNYLSSDSSSELDFITTSRAKNATFMSSASPVEVNHEKLKWELEEQRHTINKVISNCKEDLKINLYCEDSKNGSTCDDLYGDRGLNSIKNKSGRIGSATNDVSEFSCNKLENSVGKLLYDSYRLREIISRLRDRKCLAPAVAEVLLRECENVRDGAAVSACLRNLSLALQCSAKTAIRHHSEEHLNKFNDLQMDNLILRNRNRFLENKLMLDIPNIVEKDGNINTPQQLTRKSEPEALSAQIKKRYEVLANETIEVPKREKMASQSFESTDSAPDKEAKMSESLENSMKGIVAKFTDTDLGSDKVTSQSSENTDSSMSEEVDKDSSLDEDDIVIISKQETESISSELPVSPPLPPKNRFAFDRKTSCVSSFFRKKVHKKSSGPKRYKEAIEYQRNSQKNLLDSSNSNTETKENQSFNEKPHQKSSNQCFDSSKDVGQDNNPTVALCSSFAKYLEKTPESEWLAPVKSSDLSNPAENSCMERYVPTFDQEMDQWRPVGSNQKISSEWLHPARM